MPAFRTTIYRIQVRGRDYQAAVEAVKGINSGNPLGPKYPAYVQDKNSSFLNMLGINRNPKDRPFVDGAALAEQDADSTLKSDSAEAEVTEKSQEPQEAAVNDAVEDFYPEDATAEAWTSEDEQLAEFIKACLSKMAPGA
jgi:hypothetical protein